MKSMQVKTGFGYYIDDKAHIVHKAELPAGFHQLDDAFDYIEVANKQALDLVKIWQDPTNIEHQQNEYKVQDRTRKLAIDSLVTDGQLPPDYE